MGNDPVKSPSTSPPPGPSKVRKLLTSVPGALGAIAVLLGSIMTILSQSTAIKNYFFPPKGVIESVRVELDYPQVFPFTFRSLVGSIPYLKWFHIKVDNLLNKPLLLEVSFQVRRGPATAIKSEPAEYTLPAKAKGFERDLDPGIEFLEHDVQPNKDKLEIICRILDDHHNTVFQDTTKPIDLLPNNVVDWALTSLDGSPVPQYFLLASLTMWTVTSESSVRQRTDRLRREVGQLVDTSSVNRWFARCYDQVFHNPSGIQVSPDPVPFPAPGRQTIRTPSQVLEDGQADPLEAALLLGALGRDTFRNRLWLVLIAAPVALDRPAQKNVLLSWSTDSHAWHALELARANSLSFEENHQLATDHVQKLLAEQPEIMSALNRSGVFIGQTHPTIALDFRRADRNFHITPWQ